MDEPVSWTVRVSKDTDVAVRTFLAQRGMKKGDLAKFIEEAVRWRILDTNILAGGQANAQKPAVVLRTHGPLDVLMPRVLIYCSHFCTSTGPFSPLFIEKNRIRGS
jgi:hypothetical protein